MTRCRFIVLTIALLVGCGRKDTDENETKPATESAAKAKDVVELTEAARTNAQIKTVTVTYVNFIRPLRLPGRITYDLNRTAKVSSPFEGRIEKLNFDIGATVKQGEVVALIDSPELLKPLELKAPIDGLVVERLGTVGELLDKGKEFYTISDPSTVWCIASVNEADSGALQIGQPVEVQLLAFKKDTFAGRVVLPGQAVNETTRTLEARIEVDNPDRKLKPGMFATVSIPTDTIGNHLVIPDEAVQTVNGQSCVFVEEQPDMYRLRPVRLGEQFTGQDEVLEGLTEGTRIVTTGSFVLKGELLKASMEAD